MRDVARDHRQAVAGGKPHLSVPLLFTGYRVISSEPDGAGPYGTMVLAQLSPDTDAPFDEIGYSAGAIMKLRSDGIV
jgi:hypothetical protein